MSARGERLFTPANDPQLRELIEQAKALGYGNFGPDGANGHDEPKSLKLYTLNEFVQRPTVSSHVRGIIPARSIVVGFGPPKGGKTFTICDLAMHAAHGLDWHGCAIPRRLKVAYLAGEGISGLRVRLKAWLEHHESIEQPGEFRILPLAISLPDQVFTLAEALLPFGPDIVVTDTLNAYFGGGDENSTKDMSVWCDAVRYLRDCLGCSIVVIHHTGHGDSGRERGSIVLRATADVLIQIAKDENSGLVGFQVIAGRDIESMGSAIALKLVRHETEWRDAEGEPLVSCIVTGANEPVTLPGRGGRPLGDTQSTMLQIARDLAKTATREPSGEVILIRADIAELARQRGLSKTAISNTWERLERRGYWRRVEPGSIALRSTAP